MARQLLVAFAASFLFGVANTACISSGDETTITNALSSGGEGAVVQLCPGAVINIANTINFTAADQEISTQGYPTDSTRGTIIIAPGNDCSVAINGAWQDGARIMNVIVDGNRPNAGYFDGDALIAMGGGTNGQVVSHIVTKNTRSWSCLHHIGSGETDNPCRNATITYNDVGPCGVETNGQWADGISMECTDTLVAYNNIQGTTDGAIVVFGAPGSHIMSNNITSSTTQLGFGAINMVDNSYNGNYSNVVVSDNIITGVGDGLFNLGIGMGNDVWSFNNPAPYFGPTTVSDNTFVGNIGFSIVINGWGGGLTVTGNDVSGVTSPTSQFADASSCSAQVQDSFDANSQLVVYQPDLTGTSSLQSGFVSVPDNATNWLCLSHPLADSVTFAAGSPEITAANGGRVASLHGFYVQIQGNGNLVGYDDSTGSLVVKWATSVESSACGSDGSSCYVVMGGDGNYVEYDANGPIWSTGTQGEGSTVTFYNAEPYWEIKDASGNSIWTFADFSA